MDPALTALNRFGMGARMGERARLRDPRGWLEGQLRAEAALVAPEGLPTARDAADATAALQKARRSRDEDALQAARRSFREILAKEEDAELRSRVVSETPFVERLVAFWSNHLCVSASAKPQVAPLAGLYVREAIRPHVLGSFAELVLASAHHPAMVLYLDNFQSVGPDSPAARMADRAASRRRARKGPVGSGGGEPTGSAGTPPSAPRPPRGINENYARELMELHTVGVEGGYTQDDVIQLARILTGWSVRGIAPRERGQPTGYVFRAAAHEPGSKVFLGTRYHEAGEAEGERAIRDLCAHPSTATFIAGKLVRHFVSDDPPPTAVERVAGTFRDTGGDLTEVSRSLVRLGAAWEAPARKIRTPQDWIVAMLRAVGARDVPPAMAAVLRQLRHPLWAPAAPKGYGDGLHDWADPDGLMHRAELARTLAGRLGGTPLEPKALLDVVDVADSDPLPGMLRDSSIAKDERLALALGGPAFQWR